MSQILSRHLKIHLGPKRVLSIPRAQILHFRHGVAAKTLQARIEIRISTGELVLFGTELDDLWARLVNGEFADLHVGVALEPGRIETYTTTLDDEFLAPASAARDEAGAGLVAAAAAAGD